MDAFLLEMLRQPIFAGSLLLGAGFQLFALIMLALPSLQARRRAQAARRAARPEQVIVEAVQQELSQEEAAPEEDAGEESESEEEADVMAVGDDEALLAMLEEDDEEEPVEEVEEEGMDFNDDLSDIFEDDIIVDPSFRALTESLPAIELAALLGEVRDVRQQLATW